MSRVNRKPRNDEVLKILLTPEQRIHFDPQHPSDEIVMANVVCVWSDTEMSVRWSDEVEGKPINRYLRVAISQAHRNSK